MDSKQQLACQTQGKPLQQLQPQKQQLQFTLCPLVGCHGVELCPAAGCICHC